MQKLTRYSPGGYGVMVPDEAGDYVRMSEIEPLVQKAVDHAKDSGILAGSIIADENAEELAKARERIAELEDDVKRLLGGVDAFEGLCGQYHDENLVAHDLLRWRDAAMPPKERGEYLVRFGDDRETWHEVIRWCPDFPHMGNLATHWRPIGPMPTEGGE